MKTNRASMSTKTLVMAAILTALVTVLQFMGAFIRFGPFSISLVLIPIVIGAATCGTKVSTWLGFAFGVVVLLSGDAAAFLAVDELGTIATVLVKGTAAGFCAGFAYNGVLMTLGRIFKQKISRNIAVLVAAIVCPVVNTGVFLIGCLLFFMETVSGWAAAAGLGGNVGQYMILGLVGANFLFELASNIILSPVAVRIVQARKKV